MIWLLFGLLKKEQAMKTLFLFVCLLFFSCAGGTVLAPYQVEMVYSVELPKPQKDLPKKDSLAVGSFSHNERSWEPANLREFVTIVEWAKLGVFSSDRIILQKQIGEASLVCEIRPEAIKSSRSPLKAEYLVFFVQKKIAAVDFGDLVKQKNFLSPKIIEIPGMKILVDDSQEQHRFSAPEIYFQSGEYFFRAILLYRGMSKSYVNNIFNKFPWASLLD